MKLIKSYVTVDLPNSTQLLKDIEEIGRVCYKSEDKISKGSASKFVRRLVKSNHLSVLEHKSITVRFVINRAISHELVRHRIGSYTQESTRYCNYSKDKFDNSITYIIPDTFDLEPGEYFNTEGLEKPEDIIFVRKLIQDEKDYFDLIKAGKTPQIARDILPNCLKTEIVATYNLRQWITVFNQRCAKAAHPDIRKVMIPLKELFAKHLPEIFE